VDINIELLNQSGEVVNTITIDGSPKSIIWLDDYVAQNGYASWRVMQKDSELEDNMAQQRVHYISQAHEMYKVALDIPMLYNDEMASVTLGAQISLTRQLTLLMARTLFSIDGADAAVGSSKHTPEDLIALLEAVDAHVAPLEKLQRDAVALITSASKEQDLDAILANCREQLEKREIDLGSFPITGGAYESIRNQVVGHRYR